MKRPMTKRLRRNEWINFARSAAPITVNKETERQRELEKEGVPNSSVAAVSNSTHWLRTTIT
jgi:hypothetical protein